MRYYLLFSIILLANASIAQVSDPTTLDNFDDQRHFDYWWVDASGSYTLDEQSTVQVYAGTYALQVVVNKATGNEYATFGSGFLSSNPYRNWNNTRFLHTFVYSAVPITIRVDLEDQNGNKTVGLSTANHSGNGWQDLVWDLTNPAPVDITNLKSLIYFIEPGFTFSGTVYYDNVLVSSSDASLPVGLTSFTAKNRDKKVILRWITQSEVNNLGFIILKKEAENEGYRQLDSYISNPSLRGKGNSSMPTVYTYTDPFVYPSKTYWYLLIDVDYNGHCTPHGPIFVTISNEIDTDTLLTVKRFMLRQNYPNPFNPSTRITYSIPNSNFVSLKIYDIFGREIHTLVNEFQKAGTYSVRFNGSKLASAIYFYKLQVGRDFVETKKMLLLR